MALPPISGQAIQPQTQPTRSVADARAAQRAFFDAALSKAQAPTAVQRTATATAAPVRPSPILNTAPAAEPSPDRPRRPGSLVNIVV